VLSSGGLCWWDIATGKLVRELDRDVKDVYARVNNVALDPQGRWAATGHQSEPGALGIWPLDGTEKRLLKHEGKFLGSPGNARIVDLVFNNGGTELYTTDGAGVLLWDCATWKAKQLGKDVGGFDLVRDGERFYLASGDRIHRWDGEWVVVFESAEGILRLAVHDEAAYTGTRKGGVEVWDIVTGKRVRRLQLPHRHEQDGKYLRDDDVGAIAVSGNRLYAATGNVVCVYDRENDYALLDQLEVRPVPKEPTAVTHINCMEARADLVVIGTGAGALVYRAKG
jgi:WD40 repeat protein